MSDEELAAARALLYDEEAGDPTENLTSEWASVRYNAEVRLAARALLDEVDALRAHVAELESDVERRRQALEFANDRIRRRDEQNAELHEIARAVAEYGFREYDGLYSCDFCDVSMDTNRRDVRLDDLRHDADCIVTKARKLLGMEQGPAEEGEA